MLLAASARCLARAMRAPASAYARLASLTRLSSMEVSNRAVWIRWMGTSKLHSAPVEEQSYEDLKLSVPPNTAQIACFEQRTTAAVVP